ncbi:DUF445 domain-containing protein [Algiphilus sp. W345]|uniref:DUF445 domain-containing protein n=2 Tax=Banduia mediterranea TaxID=3075609 RepID=A0ABU2WEZ4_9GAMM|nr:DUF445 domain-containing protein [Algiphilus sp. W345]MDT0496421.1 DUF445 domain-containing protein [Algiphilus sp. W345]
MTDILADIGANWLLYASMPLVAALIGYGTKLAAIYMMFEPIRFVGIRPPFLGWQGVVPRNAERMAAIACDTLTARLLKPEELFARLEPWRVALEVQRPLSASVETIVREVCAQQAPDLWSRIPDVLRRTLLQRIEQQTPALVEEMMTQIRENLSSVFDLRHMVVSLLSRDKRLLNQMFREVGHAEFRFIRRSGIYFGLLIGLVQALAWALTHSVWIMPVFGGLTGWFSDWLALKLVFRPKQPTRYLGLFTWQGLFLQHRHEVAASYARMIAQRVLTPAAILDAVLSGPLSDRLYAMIQREISDATDREAGLAQPFVVSAIGTQRFLDIKRAVTDQVLRLLPEAMSHAEPYVAEALDLEKLLTEKMRGLSADEFEALLRPAFQQDEWILIAVGAALGFLVGEIQVHVMLAFADLPG